MTALLPAAHPVQEQREDAEHGDTQAQVITGHLWPPFKHKRLLTTKNALAVTSPFMPDAIYVKAEYPAHVPMPARLLKSMSVGAL